MECKIVGFKKNEESKNVLGPNEMRGQKNIGFQKN